jgi:membrane dipeptidase
MSGKRNRKEIQLIKKMEISKEAIELHKSSMVIDLHVDTLLIRRLIGYDIKKRHDPLPTRLSLFGHADIPRLKEGGVGLVCLGLVPNPVWKSGGYPSVQRQLDIWDELAASTSEIRHAGTAAEAEKARSEGVVAALMGMEGAHGLSGDISRVEGLRKRGMRYLTLLHFSRNEAGNPAMGLGSGNKAGLNKFGFELVDELDRLKIILDLAHINKNGFMDAAKRTRNPFIVSHTGISGVHDMWRNIDDEQLKAVADKGAVAGIIFAPKFLVGKYDEDPECVIRHIDYVVNKIGEDHVGLGSDFDGFIIPPAGLRDISDLPVLTDLMLRKGYKPERIRKILGGNFMRVYKTVCG